MKLGGRAQEPLRGALAGSCSARPRAAAQTTTPARRALPARAVRHPRRGGRAAGLGDHQLQSVLLESRGRRRRAANASPSRRRDALRQHHHDHLDHAARGLRHALRRAGRNSVRTGNLNPAAADAGVAGFGLGDVLLTPVALYGERGDFDYTFQFTVWSASGRFEPGLARQSRSGLLVAGLFARAASGTRPEIARDWSVSAIARIEQNFEQAETGISPGDDLVIDWGVGKVLGEGALRRRRLRVRAPGSSPSSRRRRRRRSPAAIGTSASDRKPA